MTDKKKVQPKPIRLLAPISPTNAARNEPVNNPKIKSGIAMLLYYLRNWWQSLEKKVNPARVILFPVSHQAPLVGTKLLGAEAGQVGALEEALEDLAAKRLGRLGKVGEVLQYVKPFVSHGP